MRYETLARSEAGRKVVLGGLLLCLASAAFAEEPPVPLTLSKAVEIAVAGNPGLEATRIKGRQIQAMLDESKAAFLPVVGVSYTAHRGDWPHIMIANAIDARAFPESAYLNFPGTYSIFAAIVEARMNLWAGGRDVARRNLLRTATEICGTDNDTARNKLAAQVIESFYDARAAEERLIHAKQLVETTRVRRDETKTKYEQGAVILADLQDVEAFLAEAEAGVAHVTASRSRFLASLSIAMGLPAATVLTLSERDEAEQAVPGDYDSGLSRALLTRPELARASLMNRRFELALRMAKASYYPRVDAYLSIGSYRDGHPIPELNREQKVWYGNVMLSWDVFDGGARAARMAKARAELDEQLEVDRKTSLEVELDVRNAYLRIDEALAQLNAAEQRLSAAREMRDVKRSRYEAGGTTLADSMEGELMLTDALMNRTNASFELRKATADAARALGLFVRAGGEGPSCCSVPATQ